MSDDFDPDDAAAQDSGLFGLPHTSAEAAVHVIPVPFDATTSYRKGAARGPAAVLAASRQVDLFDLSFGRPWESGICLLPADERLEPLNAQASRAADRVIAVGGRIGADERLARDLAQVNAIGAQVNEIVREQAAGVLDQGKLPALLGGDHSTPFGLIQAASERFPGLGVLHFDAHADLREAYEGFSWSHASIMHNVVTRLPGVATLVQIGLRDVGEREVALIEDSRDRVHALWDRDWGRARLEGRGLRDLVRRALAQLPQQVHVSFDIDGLDPALCPNTGTPVPGGLTWNEAMLWLEELAGSGKRVVSLDLNEVSPGAVPVGEDSWDAIVGARLLYRLIGAALATR